MIESQSQIQGLILTRYDDLNLYNENLISAGAYLLKPVSDWKGRFGLVYYHDSIDGSSFQQRLALELRADRYYARGQRLRLRYDYTQYNDLDARYDYLNGWRQRFTVENRGRIGSHELRLGYKYELNNRDDFYSATSFFSYSPIRHTVYGMYEYSFTQQWLAQVMAEYRRSDYQEANISNGVNLGVQQDDRSRYRLAGIYRLSRNAEFELSWRYTNNRSNITTESYVSNLTMLSFNYYF